MFYIYNDLTNMLYLQMIREKQEKEGEKKKVFPQQIKYHWLPCSWMCVDCAAYSM